MSTPQQTEAAAKLMAILKPIIDEAFNRQTEALIENVHMKINGLERRIIDIEKVFVAATNQIKEARSRPAVRVKDPGPIDDMFVGAELNLDFD